jgi:hypothetical protein
LEADLAGAGLEIDLKVGADSKEDQAITVLKEAPENETTLKIETLEALKEDPLLKCTMLCALNVAKTVKFLSSPQVISLFFAMTASKVKAEDMREELDLV